jgi:hypothetical protein
MKQNYPLTLAAAKKNKSSLWELGDALLKECPADSSKGTLDEVVTYLQANGQEYTGEWLRQMRQVAAAFPPKSRRLELSFVVHQEAETPQMLEAVIKGAPKGAVISHRYVRKIVDRIRDHEQRARREAFEKAQAKREAAEAKEREKLARAKAAKDATERKALEEEHREAAKRTEAARKAEQAAKVPPRRQMPPLQPPAETEVPVLLAEATFTANAERAIVLAREAIEVIEGSVHELTVKGVAGLTECALEAANAWKEAAQLVRKEVVDQRGHLSVMEH